MNEENMGDVKINKIAKPSSVYFEMFLGTLNILVSTIVLLFSGIVQIFREELTQLIGTQFTLDFKNLIIINIPILVFGILLHIYSLERVANKKYKLYGFFIFLLGFVMTGLITFLIVKYSLNWFGVSLFGKTSIGLNKLFYFPSIAYIAYSLIIIYYSIGLMRR
ncbi:hypothetical protein OSSY52_03350 [Tepiditoga spiralis]|uniref:Uncharacterized protein n=1 Tax=Tepiditoga spiralis TaxID=2108365 RepID=A0A7G1G595_9BACT|nr:hypothetical protein [Tepiditoga spiralis]BBE30194.1 hypothetical protein OSSY52_03350 [Tepiditoga spiralis]